MTDPHKSIAHRVGMNHYGAAQYPDGLVDWRDAQPPDLTSGDGRRTTGRLRSCGYCGSMHPADLAAALRAGATLEWADAKYGWPHKAYVERIPNPHAGLLESRMGSSHAVPACPKTGQACEHGEQSFSDPKCECLKGAPETVKQGMHGKTAMVAMPDGYARDTGKPTFTWRDTGEPAPTLTHGKFYSVHLMDATPEDRDVIERAMGLRIRFSEDGQKVSWSRLEPDARLTA